MVWQPGQSGNPNGHRRDPLKQHVKDLARSWTADAMESLHCVAMLGKDAKMLQPGALGAVVKACEVILERGWGKAITEAEMRHQSRERVSKMSDADLRARAESILRRIPVEPEKRLM